MSISYSLCKYLMWESLTEKFWWDKSKDIQNYQYSICKSDSPAAPLRCNNLAADQKSIQRYFLLFCKKTTTKKHVGTHWNHLDEAIPISTHNIWVFFFQK